VDRNLRTFDVDNLYVVGSSVFPTSGQANPTFTSVALAIRLAQRLAHGT
jgi:choline dehydrogenase-like flavoprotein